MVFADPEFVEAKLVAMVCEMEISSNLTCGALVVGVIGGEEHAAAERAGEGHEVGLFFRRPIAGQSTDFGPLGSGDRGRRGGGEVKQNPSIGRTGWAAKPP